MPKFSIESSEFRTQHDLQRLVDAIERVIGDLVEDAFQDGMDEGRLEAEEECLGRS